MPPEESMTYKRGIPLITSGSLRFRFLFWISVVLFCTLGATALYVYQTQQSLLEKQLNSKIDAIGHFIALISPSAIYAFDITTLDRYVRQISSDPDVRFAQIRTIDGQPLTTYLPEQTQSEDIDKWIAKHKTAIKSSKGIQAEIHVFEFPIYGGDNVLGWVEIGLNNMRTVENTRQMVTELTIIFALIVAALGALIYFIFEFQVLNPIGTLAQGASRVALREYDQPVPVYSNDELGQLALCFNSMIKEIKTDRENLLESNEKLATEIHYRRIATDELKKLSLAVEQSPASVLITDLLGNIEYVNPKFCEISGYTRNEVLGQHSRMLGSGDMDTTYYENLWNRLKRGEIWKGEFCNRRKNGNVYWESAVIAPIRGDNAEVTHYLAVKEDITERKAFEQKLLEQATHDQLTGLPNRFLAFDRLKKLLQFAERHHQHIAVIYIDLDDFKTINDTLGHVVGDQLLIQAAQRIKAQLRGEDTLARLGGDEFMAVVSELNDSSNDLHLIIDRLQTAMQAPFYISDKEIPITSSLGIALYPDNGEDIGSLMSNADMAMYEAKHAGRNTYRFFTSEMNRKVTERVALESHLRHALNMGEFYPVYQPVIRLKDGVLVGTEVLLRWKNDELGQIAPTEFIPVLEKSGLIKPVTEWLFSEILSHAKQWKHLPQAFWMAVNVSPIYFSDPSFDSTLTAIQEHAAGINIGLCVEITENLLLQSGENVNNTFRHMKSIGVYSAMDDFGTGYSSLAYIKRFPLNFLKIDREFISGLPMDEDDRSLTEAIVLMGHKLGLTLIAEGVENEAQIDYLKSLNVDHAQGYYFAHPLRNEDFITYLNNVTRNL
jgi:diguanylate cyclase (GGDEF)-like protein/PAS domain S-box-containing protein